MTAAAAAAEDPVYALYASGDYDGAVRAGEATHTAAGYAMAARALLGQEMLRDSPCLDCLKRAEQFARRAVAADPRFAWGQLWLAVSLGYEARITGIVRARLDDVPAQGRDDRVPSLVGAHEVVAHPAEVVAGQLTGQVVQEVFDTRAGCHRTAQVVVEDLRGAGLQVVGLQAVQVEGLRRLGHGHPP